MGNKTKGRRGQAPKPVGGTVADLAEPTDYNKRTPVFCLHHLQKNFDVSSLSKDQRAAFAMTLQDRAKLTWQDMIQSGRHKMGFELLPSDAISAPVPPAYQDAEKFMVLRYFGKLPMVGVRANEVFHVLWIAKNFNELYDHG